MLVIPFVAVLVIFSKKRYVNQYWTTCFSSFIAEKTKCPETSARHCLYVWNLKHRLVFLFCQGSRTAVVAVVVAVLCWTQNTEQMIDGVFVRYHWASARLKPLEKFVCAVTNFWLLVAVKYRHWEYWRYWERSKHKTWLDFFAALDFFSPFSLTLECICLSCSSSSASCSANFCLLAPEFIVAFVMQRANTYCVNLTLTASLNTQHTHETPNASLTDYSVCNDVTSKN